MNKWGFFVALAGREELGVHCECDKWIYSDYYCSFIVGIHNFIVIVERTSFASGPLARHWCLVSMFCAIRFVAKTVVFSVKSEVQRKRETKIEWSLRRASTSTLNVFLYAHTRTASTTKLSSDELLWRTLISAVYNRRPSFRRNSNKTFRVFIIHECRASTHTQTHTHEFIVSSRSNDKRSEREREKIKQQKRDDECSMFIVFFPLTEPRKKRVDCRVLFLHSWNAFYYHSKLRTRTSLPRPSPSSPFSLSSLTSYDQRLVNQWIRCVCVLLSPDCFHPFVVCAIVYLIKNNERPMNSRHFDNRHWHSMSHPSSWMLWFDSVRFNIISCSLDWIGLNIRHWQRWRAKPKIKWII